MKTNDDEYFKSMTREHYNKYIFQEPDIEGLKKYIENRELIQNVLHLKNVKEPVLDAGCGTWKYTKLLEMYGIRNITGIDIFPNELEIARRYLKHTRLEEGDAANLRNFKNNSFNTVLSFGVAHYTLSPRKVFEECARVFKWGYNNFCSLQKEQFVLLGLPSIEQARKTDI